MSRKKLVIIIVGIVVLIPVVAALILVMGVGYYFGFDHGFEKAVDTANVFNFEECVANGNPLMESYPAQCSYKGKTYTQDIGNELEMRDLVNLSSPRPNQKITSPLEITGEARGSWFFEAGFPIELQDGNGIVLAKTQAQANRDWMTTDFVPFTAEIVFPKSTTAKGKLILRKDNPSDLPENDKSLVVPVNF